MNDTYFEILVYALRQEQLNIRVENKAERVMADVPNYVIFGVRFKTIEDIC